MFKTGIIKLTAICNLNCDYCYMFNLSDKTYLEMPKMMSPEIACLVVERIVAYLKSRGERDFLLCLHGGEPTLWRQEYFKSLFEMISSQNRKGCNIDVSLQTNLYKLPSRSCLDLFRDNGIRFGISVDGPQIYNDQHRFTFNGYGSYARIMRNVELLKNQGYGDLIGGFLCVANPEIPPEEFWAWVKTLPVTRLDVLWPIEFNEGNPPWHHNGKLAYSVRPLFGDWFAKLFKLWWDEDDPRLYVRLFDHLVKIFLAGHGSEHVDFLVNDQVNMFVVNTDGSIEYPDYLRASSDGSVKTGLNIAANTLDELHDDKVFQSLLTLKDFLPQDCKSCFFREICGGGFLPGRAVPGALISSERSVLCEDQLWFFQIAFDLVYGRVSVSSNPGEYSRAIPLFATI